jgi:uroporphyrinogen-III synthase
MQLCQEKTLYLGLDPTRYNSEKSVVHFPIIKIIPKTLESLLPQFLNAIQATHLLFTSRVAVRLFFAHTGVLGIDCSHKKIIAIGKATASLLRKWDFISKEETAEGIVELLKGMDFDNGHLFLPTSSIARKVIPSYLDSKSILYTQVYLYDTVPTDLLPPLLGDFDTIVFSSPSTVEAFYKIYGYFPKEKKLLCLGPVTQKRLDNFLSFSYRNSN